MRVSDAITTLSSRHVGGGKLVILSCIDAIDARDSRFATSARGYAPTNSYLLVEDDRSLLIDTGLRAHCGRLVEAVTELVGRSRLAILHTRLGEYESVCNTAALIDAIDVEVLYGNQHAATWIGFHPDERRPAMPRSHRLATEETLAVDEDGQRCLDVFMARLRLLPTFWAFDRLTGTLFTSDMFSYVTRARDDGPWVIGADDDDTAFEAVEQHLLTGRYWWLSHAHTEQLAEALEAVFARYDVSRIAPGYGCVLEGREVVRRHVAMVASVLRASRAAS